MKARLPRKRLLLLLLTPLLAASIFFWRPPSALAAPTPAPVPIPQSCLEANVFYGAVPPGGENAPVLVFVHGYGGQAIDWWFFNFGSGFNDMYDLAYAAGYRTAFVTDNLNSEAPDCDVPRRPVISVFDAGAILSQQLALITAHYNVDQVSIVAHSKGGVDTQAALAFYGAGDKIANVFTLSSPHQGEILADLVWSASDIPGLGDLLAFFGRDEGLRTLRVNNMKVFRLYVDELPVHNNISYYSAAGTGWQGSGGITEIGGLILQILGYDNDGVVTVESTYLPYALPFFVADYNHNEIYQGHNVFHYIQDVLEAQPLVAELAGATTGATNTSYSFTASAQPITLTVPLTYTWEVTGQPPLTVAGERENTAAFSWTNAGTKIINVTISNRYGSASQSMNIDIAAPTPNTGPTNVTIDGDDRANAGTAATFTANVTPLASSQPLQYTWSATNQGTVIHSNGLNDSVTFTWSSTGIKTVSVSVSNGVGTVGSSFNVNVGRPPTTLNISGPTVGSTNTNYNYTATANANVSSPVSYTWSTVDHDDVEQIGGSSNTLGISWPESGQQPIAVKAENAWGSTVAFYTVDIQTPPITVTLSGDAIGVINTTHFFDANTEPPETTVPLTYTWQSSGTPAQLTQTNDLSDQAGFVWGIPGTQSVSVTAANAGGGTADNATIDIQLWDPGVAPSSLQVSGPTDGLINTPYQFVAAVTPLKAAQPVTYVWQINGQTVRTQQSGGNDVTTFSWPEGGSYEISVTATNDYGSVGDSLTIEVVSPIRSVTANWPDVLPLNGSYDFVAAVQPVTSTTPITYTWWTPDLYNEVIHVTDALTDTFTYAFTTTGAKAFAVTVNNGAGDVQTSTTIEVIRPVTSVGVDGPISGIINNDYTFTATVLPANATTPVDYVWEASDQAPVVHTGDLSDEISFAWSSGGTKTITVTASNGLNSYSDSMTIEIAETVMPPEAVTLDGPTSGAVGMSYTFTADVTPLTTTTPLTYTWEATDMMPTVRGGGLSDAIDFTWTNAGIKTITVTAENEAGSVSDTFTIVIDVPVTAPADVEISGPQTGFTGIAYDFTAGVTPPTTTLPVTYTWTATGQSPVVHSGALSDGVSFTWNTVGTKTIMVTAENDAGSVSASTTIVISAVDVAPTSVDLAGANDGDVDVSYTFSAEVMPANTTTPLTYEWSATDQANVVHTGGLSDSVSFSWSSAGIKTVSLTVYNNAGTVTQSTTIKIAEPVYNIYLPFVVGSSAPGDAAAQMPKPSGGLLGHGAGKAQAALKPIPVYLVQVAIAAKPD